ncbi:MAG: hypothetical protein IPK19_40910 [Chloroflexi bacterium]|nr:hypothetical protein [Chloroflexota bacterium]
MFKKILVANRGEIAVRVIQTCREMGIKTVALYAPQERRSLHVQNADEAVPFAGDFSDQERILAIATERGVDAIHPGYGFLAEEPDFIRACAAAGITFIGPSADLLDQVHDKVATLTLAMANGFHTVESSQSGMAASDQELFESATRLAATAMSSTWANVKARCSTTIAS